jgi:hypothetical protein
MEKPKGAPPIARKKATRNVTGPPIWRTYTTVGAPLTARRVTTFEQLGGIDEGLGLPVADLVDPAPPVVPVLPVDPTPYDEEDEFDYHEEDDDDF